MNIPEILRQKEINFVLLEKSGKKPFQQGWQKKKIKYDNKELLNHIISNGNYGVMGGGKKNLIIVDFDDEAIEKEAMKKLPETFTVKTGSGRLHLYYFSDKADSFKIFNEEIDTLADVQGEGKQVVGPGSIHPNGNVYEVVNDIEISFLPYAEARAILMAYDKKPKKEEEQKQIKYEGSADNFIDTLTDKVSVEDVLGFIGINTSKNPTECPFHSSQGGKCLGFKRDVAHCFHCEESWNIISLIKQHKNCGAKESIEILADIGGLRQELEDSRKKYVEEQKAQQFDEKREIRTEYLELISGKTKNWSEATELLRDYVLRTMKIYTTKDDLKSEMWVYDEGVYVPQGRSEVKVVLRDLLEQWYSNYIYNKVIEKIEPDTFIDSQRFFSYNNKEEVPVENGLLNIFTLELKEFDNTKIFFNKMPVKYDMEIGCPKIEKFLKDVLSKEEDITVFYELAGFSLMKEYTFEKAFMFVGDGRNGKGKSIELLKKLVGIENCCSVPLSSLIPESFSISELFGKFLNLAGDIGNQDLKDTSMFKSLTGRDLVGGKRKFMRNVNFENYAKFVFACNELPMVYDLTRGFWDRWVLLEFPYTFVSKNEYDSSDDNSKLKIKDPNIIEKISTPEEMSGFLNQALAGLHRLLKNKKFSATKGCEEVKGLWIRKSNSFIALCYDLLEEDQEGFIKKKDLRKVYSDYCKKHGIPSKSDYVIKKALQDMFGATDERRETSPGMWEWYWTGIKFRVVLA